MKAFFQNTPWPKYFVTVPATDVVYHSCLFALFLVLHVSPQDKGNLFFLFDHLFPQLSYWVSGGYLANPNKISIWTEQDLVMVTHGSHLQD